MSVCNRDSRNRRPRARRDPVLVSLELDAEPVVEDPQIPLPVTHNRLRHDCFNFLRHHTDIGAIAAVITEAIVADAVGEMAKQNDVVFDRDVGSPSAATSAGATAAATATPEAAATATEAAGSDPASAETSAAQTTARRSDVRSPHVLYRMAASPAGR